MRQNDAKKCPKKYHNLGQRRYNFDPLGLEVVRIYLSDQKFNHNPESNEDIHWAHFEPITRPLKPLADYRAADLFWCGPEWLGPSAEIQGLPDNRLGALGVWLWAQSVPNGCLHWILGYG